MSRAAIEVELPELLSNLPGRGVEYRLLALEAALQVGLVLLRGPRGVALCDAEGTPYVQGTSLMDLGMVLLERRGMPDPEPDAAPDAVPAHARPPQGGE